VRTICCPLCAHALADVPPCPLLPPAKPAPSVAPPAQASAPGPSCKRWSSTTTSSPRCRPSGRMPAAPCAPTCSCYWPTTTTSQVGAGGLGVGRWVACTQPCCSAQAAQPPLLCSIWQNTFQIVACYLGAVAPACPLLIDDPLHASHHLRRPNAPLQAPFPPPGRGPSPP